MSFMQKLFGSQKEQNFLNKELDDLKSSDGNTRLHSVKALGKIADNRTVDPLITMLSDKYLTTNQLGESDDNLFDTSVRLEAAEALGNIGDSVQ